MTMQPQVQSQRDAARADASALALDFVEFAVQAGALRFGEFKTKAGRLSPYFFNAGLFDDGAKLGRLAQFYARRLLRVDSNDNTERNEPLAFDMLFGPAYKGITLASAVSVELARQGCNRPFAFNRKEAKDHGEGGRLVGAPLAGRVCIVDDVISAGTSVRESLDLIAAAGAIPCAVTIALDRQEKATDNGADVPWSALQFVQRRFGLQVLAIATLTDLLSYLQSNADPALRAHAEGVATYRERYGV